MTYSQRIGGTQVKNNEQKYVAGLSSSQEKELRKAADTLGMFNMENKMFRKLQGLLEDINENEIVSHILDGTLISWLSSWKMKCGMLTAFLVENDKANMVELDKLRRENFGLKTTVKNQREKLDKFYRTY